MKKPNLKNILHLSGEIKASAYYNDDNLYLLLLILYTKYTFFRSFLAYIMGPAYKSCR